MIISNFIIVVFARKLSIMSNIVNIAIKYIVLKIIFFKEFYLDKHQIIPDS